MRIINLLVMAFLLVSLMPVASSEVFLWNSVIKDEADSLTRYHAYYYFDDTSETGIGADKDVPITLTYQVQALPFDLQDGDGVVDWCNLSYVHYQNIYGTDFVAFQGFVRGELENTTIVADSIYFGSGNATSDDITINMKSRDTLIVDMDCHYNQTEALYKDNALIGRFDTYMPSFECVGCGDYTIEELSNQIEKNDEIIADELEIYDAIQTAIDWNFTLWLIVSWILKIAFVLIAITLIFSAVYYYYIFFRDIGRSI